MKLPTGYELFLPTRGDYQLETIIHGIITKDPALLLDLGLGKTYTALQIARYRIKSCNVKKVLIFAPTSLLYTWQKKGVEWCTEYKAIILHSKGDDRIRLINEFKDNPNIHFGIINYEALAPFGVEIDAIPLDMIIADESSRYIKNPLAKRTQATMYFGDKTKHNIILSGTLITKRPLDIWSQYRFLDGGATFGINYYEWRKFFFNKHLYAGREKWEVNKERVNILTKHLFINAIQFSKKEVWKDRKEPIFTDIIIPKHKVEPHYSQIEKEVIAEIETEIGSARINTANIFTRLIRLQQLTGGFIKSKDGIQPLVRQPKLDALIDEVDSILDADEAVVVWCRFHASLDLVCNTLKEKEIKTIKMSGKDNHKKKEEKWRTYQSSKEIKVFVGQIEAGGIGIELFKLDSEDVYQHTIYYEKTWVKDHYEQSLGRTDRIGQNATCRYVNIMIEDTIDERIHNCNEKDIRISDAIMGKGIKNFLKGE